jgi:ABC-type amino acid transport substrate-binding protein
MAVGAARAEEVASGPLRVEVAVRIDAKPFAWRDPKSGAFRGYLVDLCREAVLRAGFLPNEIGMSSVEREQVLDGATDSIRGVRFDLMCDPTTISLDRLQKLKDRDPPDQLVFSPIVFVANGTYFQRKDYVRSLAPREPESAVAFVRRLFSGAGEDAGAAPTGVVYPAPEGCDELNADQASSSMVVIGHLQGATARAVAVRAVHDGVFRGSRVCLRAFESHTTAVAAICGDPDGKDAIDVYFGDSDIILANRTDQCAIEPAPRPRSYEPYALVMSNRTLGFRERFLIALYELFSDGTANNRFNTYFSGYAQSGPLEALFRINSIPGLREGSGQRDPQGSGAGDGSEQGGEGGEPGQQQEGIDGVSAVGGGGDYAGAEDQGRQIERQHEHREQQAAAADADG